MRKIFAAVLLAASVTSVGNLKAEPNETAKWLMEQPVTLWDRGMDAMRDEARNLYDIEPGEWLIGAEVELLVAGANYDWEANEIDFGTWFRGVQHDVFIDHEWCNYVRRRVIERVLGITTRSGMDEESIEKWMDVATRIIGDWFSHTGFRHPDRDEKLGSKMARIIFVGVEMSGEDGSGIECRDRITSLDAPSKPVN